MGNSLLRVLTDWFIALDFIAIVLAFLGAAAASAWAHARGKKAEGLDPVGRAATYLWWLVAFLAIMEIGALIKDGRDIQDIVDGYWKVVIEWLKANPLQLSMTLVKYEVARLIETGRNGANMLIAHAKSAMTFFRA